MSALFARHTLVVYRIDFRQPRKNDLYRIDDVDGHDILDLVDDFCSTHDPLIQIRDTEKFLRIENHTREENLVIIDLQSGRAGLGGSIVNTRTTKESYGYGADEAGMVDSRVVFYRREGYGYALVCVERVPNDAGSTALLSSFKSFLRESNVKGIMEHEQIKRDEAVLAFKGVEDIEVRRYAKSTDISDGLLTESRYISHIAKHKPRQFFPFSMIDALANRQSRSAWLGIPEDFDGREEVRYTLRGYDGSTRTYVLGDDIKVPLVEILNDSGERPLSNSDFVSRCQSACETISESFGRMM